MAFNTTQAKSIFQSTTFWGAVVSMFGVLAPGIYSKVFGAASQPAIVGDIMAGIGFIVTVYGRFTAKQVVTLTGGPPPSPTAMKGTAG